MNDLEREILSTIARQGNALIQGGRQGTRAHNLTVAARSLAERGLIVGQHVYGGDVYSLTAAGVVSAAEVFTISAPQAARQRERDQHGRYATAPECDRCGHRSFSDLVYDEATDTVMCEECAANAATKEG